ncbi:MAG: AraC family ligand binding domain-containing protein, partial [Prevotella sp.]|nr:AraC family ligand binding domain-containing protein [Prevotella sp.]
MNYPIDKLQLYTLNVGYAQHYGDWNWKNIRSPFARLYLVTEGSASIELPTGTYTLTPGHLYLIPAFTTHSYVCDGFFAHYYIHIYENNPDGQGILADWEFPVEVEAAS